MKMTNSLLNQWILEFKQKSSQFGVEKENQMMPEQEINYGMMTKEFEPIILVMPPTAL